MKPIIVQEGEIAAWFGNLLAQGAIQKSDNYDN